MSSHVCAVSIHSGNSDQPGCCVFHITERWCSKLCVYFKAGYFFFSSCRGFNLQQHGESQQPKTKSQYGTQSPEFQSRPIATCRITKTMLPMFYMKRTDIYICIQSLQPRLSFIGKWNADVFFREILNSLQLLNMYNIWKLVCFGAPMNVLVSRVKAELLAWTARWTSLSTFLKFFVELYFFLLGQNIPEHFSILTGNSNGSVN